MTCTAHLLFDLDGTLTDPLQGIARCIGHALTELGVPCPPETALRWCVGPPLQASLVTLLGAQRAHLAPRALALYRERFARVGLFENRVYAGVPELLRTLHDGGATLWVCTAKPTGFARRIVEHFGLAPYFRGIYGSELDGRNTDKRDLLASLLAAEGLPPRAATLIGDRAMDMAAAKAHGLRAIGAAWGYGSAQELRAAGADCLVEHPAALLRALAPARDAADPDLPSPHEEPLP
jgi:phosphoglycolate phosphatase